jgi:hypothetical protein
VETIGLLLSPAGTGLDLAMNWFPPEGKAFHEKPGRDGGHESPTSRKVLHSQSESSLALTTRNFLTSTRRASMIYQPPVHYVALGNVNAHCKIFEEENQNCKYHRRDASVPQTVDEGMLD